MLKAVTNEEEVSWTRSSTLIAERYANINIQKEVLDLLHSFMYFYLDIPCEDPYTTVARIIAYIDKQLPISLATDQSDAAKA